MDKITKKLYKIILNSQYPLSTEELSQIVKRPNYSLLTLLKKLAIEGKIKGKQLKKGGSYIWWLPDKPINKNEIESKKLRLNKLKENSSDLQKQVQSVELKKEENNQNELSEKIKELEINIQEKEDKIAEIEEDWTVSDLLRTIDFLTIKINDIINSYMKPRFRDMNEIYYHLMEQHELPYGILKKYFGWDRTS
ncbi:MAG: hypothetical protein HWN67_11905 [Candidatus Helarchaeota archaeon]|nr:hypothetical protein [Candidatus Helarchaeota archaeon]